MKITLETTYDNVDEEFLSWWLGQLEINEDACVVVGELKQHGSAVMKHFDGHVSYVTKYEIVRDT